MWAMRGLHFDSHLHLKLGWSGRGLNLLDGVGLAA